jgi:hypothetical protein
VTVGVWDIYDSRVTAKGSTKRGATIKREKRYIYEHLVDNPSYHECIVDGVDRVCGIIDTDNLDKKTIISMPNEDLRNGALVEWMDNHWLIIERDANTTMYTKCVMQQCNFFLKWVDQDGKICGQWAYVNDSTKYLTGELEDRHFMVVRGDTRLSVTIARTEDTLRLDRTTRFIIDDPDCHEHLAYVLTKPLRMGSVFNEDGVFTFIMQEVETTDNDNLDLLIADYYKYYPRESTSGSVGDTPLPTDIPSETPSPVAGGTDPNRRSWL